jgi:hypothetical protein
VLGRTSNPEQQTPTNKTKSRVTSDLQHLPALDMEAFNLRVGPIVLEPAC